MQTLLSLGVYVDLQTIGGGTNVLTVQVWTQF